MKKLGRKMVISGLSIFSIMINAYLIVVKQKNKLKNILFNASALDLPVNKFTDEDFAYYILGDRVVQISPMNDPGNSEILPEGLVVKPGFYNFNGQVYDLNNEGLYRFFVPLQTSQQRIVYKSDIDSLLSSLSWIVTHGNTDDTKSLEELTAKAKQSKLVLTCGSNIKWSQNIFQSLRLKSRMVMGLTLDKWNNYDNGHTLVEVYRPEYKKWIVYDLDSNRKFTKNGRPLSLLELVENVKKQDYELEKISDSVRVDVDSFTDHANGYNYGLLWETITSNKASLKRWYQRVLQSILIANPSGYFYFFDVKNRKRIEEYSLYHKYIPKKEFLRRFYG